MTFVLILQMLGIALLMALLYVIIGIIPGTDETSVLVPMTIVLVSLNLNPYVIMAGFISAVVTLNIADSIPTAITTIPGGVMSTPLVGHSQTMKEQGLTSFSVKWMMLGSLIGVIVSLPIALALWGLFELISVNTGMDISNFIKKYNEYIFLGGAILMSLTSKKKLVSLLIIIPFGFLTALLRNPAGLIDKLPFIFNNPVGDFLKSLKISLTPFFLSITTGPLIFALFSLLNKKKYQEQLVEGKIDVLVNDQDTNSLADGQKAVIRKTAIASSLGSLLFFLSPVGVTMMVSEFSVKTEKKKVHQAWQGVSVVNGLSSATYLAGILISLLVFAFPISPAAIGPGKVIFDTGGTFILPDNAGLTLPKGLLLIPILIGLFVGVGITIFLGIKYAHKMTRWVFKYISQETVLIFLFSIIILLSFAEAGLVGLIVVLGIGLLSGWLNKLGAGYGVQFMALYAGNLFLTALLAII